MTLRAATAGEHRAVDAAFGSVDLGDRAQYAAFLRAQAAAFLPVEAAIDRGDPAALPPDWPARRRAHLLRADLAALGADPAPPLDPPRFDSDAALLGAVYVLEGSRLGGRMLARAVPAGLPRGFIDAGEAEEWRAGGWRRLVELLDKRLQSRDEMDAAIDAARAVFARFEEGARRHLKDVRGARPD